MASVRQRDAALQAGRPPTLPTLGFIHVDACLSDFAVLTESAEKVVRRWLAR